MRYPEIWRDEQHVDVPDNFVSIINDCSTANKAVVIVKGLDEWPGEFEKQNATIDIYWIVRDGGLMLLLSQLLRAKECFESCKIQVFCIAEEETEAEELRADEKKFLYDLRMRAEVIVVTLKSWEDHQQAAIEETGREDAMETFSKARKQIALRAEEANENVTRGESEAKTNSLDEQQVNSFCTQR